MVEYYLPEVIVTCRLLSHAGSHTKPLLGVGILEERVLIVVQDQCLGAFTLIRDLLE